MGSGHGFGTQAISDYKALILQTNRLGSTKLDFDLRPHKPKTYTLLIRPQRTTERNPQFDLTMGDIAGLCDQLAVHASVEAKIHLSILATALVDALGGPAEFHQRFKFPLVTSFTPNTNFLRFGALKPGTWTDDTSMTLSLARSIAKHGFDETRQIQAYANWYQKGELSAIGKCFDIGGTIRSALEIYLYSDSPQSALDSVRAELSASHNAGNGSLMRILPIGLAYWRDPSAAQVFARKSSETTHPTSLCLEACQVWTGAITIIMQNSIIKEGTNPTPLSYSKLDLLQYISGFPYQSDLLRNALTVPAEAPPFITNQASAASTETYYQQHHPILRLVNETRNSAAANDDKGSTQDSSTHFPFAIPTVKNLPSSGYVLHTLVAALYCFFATDTFEAGAIMAVNLGDDADTVGAVYAGLAGCWYASPDEEVLEGKPTRQLFWSKKVREWKAGLVRRDIIEQVAEELVQYEKGYL